jgi:hypothetical protein
MVKYHWGGRRHTSSLETLTGASTGITAATANTSITRTRTVDTADGKAPTITIPAVSASDTPTVPSHLAGSLGISRSIGPRLLELKDADTDVEKRGLAGITAALNFATGVLKTSPSVELGTGEGGSGVGIKQALGTGAATAGKREDGSMPTVTLLKIRTIGS